MTWKDLDPEELRRLYVDRRRSPTEIGKTYGYGRQTILNALAYHEIPVRSSRRRILGEEDTRELMRLYVCRDWTKVALARKFGVGVTTVDRYIRRHFPAYTGHPAVRGTSVTELVDDYAPGLRLLYVEWQWSVDSIAHQFGCEPHDVCDALRRLDIPVTNTDASTADASVAGVPDVHATPVRGHSSASGMAVRRSMPDVRDVPAGP